MLWNCKHIIGRAWMLNPEEGPAWVSSHVRGDATPPKDLSDWCFAFKFCPCCGAELTPPEGVDVLTVNEATYGLKEGS